MSSAESPQVPPPQTGFKRVMKAFVYSWQGLKAAWKYESAFRQELCTAAVLSPWIVICDFTTVERMLLVLSMMFVLVTELLNTGIEVCIDRFGGDYHELSQRAKDIGSAAVLLSIIGASCVWLSLFLPLIF